MSRCRCAFRMLTAVSLALGSASSAKADDDAAPDEATTGPATGALPDTYDVREADASVRRPPVPVSFLSHDGGWISFQYPPSARDRVGPLIQHADDLRAELAVALGQPVLDGVEVRVARGPDELSTLAPEKAPPPAGSTAVGYPALKLAVLSLGNPGAEPADLDESFRHELSHLALYDASIGRAPRWLAEGFATSVSGGDAWSRGWVLWSATVRRHLMPFSDLERAITTSAPETRLAQAEAADFMQSMMKDDTKWRFAALVEKLAHGEAFDDAVVNAYGSNLASLERRWHADVSRRESLMTIFAGIGVPGAIVIAVAAMRRYRRRKLPAPPKPRIKARTAAGEAAVEAAGSDADRARVHIVLSRRDERVEPVILADSEIPKVEHEGEWHTLH